MTVNQRDFLQLFGTWGYTVPQLQKKVSDIKDNASRRDDKVGVIACINFESMCYFASTDNPQDAFKKTFEKFPKIHEDIKEEIDKIGLDDSTKNMVEEVIGTIIKTGSYTVEGCLDILETYFELVGNFKTFEEALVYQRHVVMRSLGNDILVDIASIAGEIGNDIFETMVKIALAEYEKSNGMPVEVELNRLGVQDFDGMINYLKSFKEAILEMPSAILPDFSSLAEMITESFYKDMPSQFDRLDFGMAEVSKVPPHRIYDFKMACCFIMTAFFLGVSLGIFSYADYDGLGRQTDKSANGFLDSDDISRIINNRSN